MWAEAVYLYRVMRKEQPTGTLPLYLTGEGAKAEALARQEDRRQLTEADIYEGQIGEWVDKPYGTGTTSTRPLGPSVTKSVSSRYGKSASATATVRRRASPSRSGGRFGPWMEGPVRPIASASSASRSRSIGPRSSRTSWTSGRKCSIRAMIRPARRTQTASFDTTSDRFYMQGPCPRRYSYREGGGLNESGGIFFHQTTTVVCQGPKPRNQPKMPVTSGYTQKKAVTPLFSLAEITSRGAGGVTLLPPLPDSRPDSPYLLKKLNFLIP